MQRNSYNKKILLLVGSLYGGDSKIFIFHLFFSNFCGMLIFLVCFALKLNVLGAGLPRWC